MLLLMIMIKGLDGSGEPPRGERLIMIKSMSMRRRNPP
jgi:hypothetical protein